MRQLLGFIALCVLVTGCVHHFEAATNELLAAISRTPLPPGNDGFTFEPDATPTSYSVWTEYQGATLEEIEDFYRNYFRENGWENVFPDETETSGLLYYEKGRATYLITIIDVLSPIRLGVDYDESEFIWEEFDVLIGESADAEALEVVEKIGKTYSALDSYRDIGHHETIDDGELLVDANFETKFLANGDILFEYKDSPSDGSGTSHVLRKKGEVIQTMSSHEVLLRNHEDISMAIATLYGVTSATSGNIPELLYGDDDQTLFRLASLCLIDDARLEDGTVCMRLQGKDFNSDEITVWVSKDSYLIRRIEEVTDADNRVTTTYRPEISIEISAEEMIVGLSAFGEGLGLPARSN